jgi:signal transduction histidine kinase
LDGSYKYFLDRAYLVHNDDGIAVRMIGSLQNITELKEKQAEVIERNRRILEIAHVNSHQVRKPLANILGLVAMLQNSKEEDGDQKELLKMLKESSEELDASLREIANKASLL